METPSIFTRIIQGEQPADLLYEDELCVAFRDIHPRAPLHALIVPRKPIVMVSDATAEDEPLLGHLLTVAAKVAAAQGYAGKFRLVINNGAAVGQTVFHIHVHVLGGRAFVWPPG
jgi:histidine triad (HIT) family protein